MATDNWQVKFAYFGHGISCETVRIGNTQAIQFGLQLAIATVKDKFQALIQSGKAEIGLLPELMLVDEISNGNIKPFEGRFLTIQPLQKKPRGLTTSVSIEWND